MSRIAGRLARLGNARVIEIFAQVIEDLVRGELMQLGTTADADARFKNYLLKTEAKTASLLARSCHSVAVLGNGELYCWGRPDFGRLGRTKNDAYTTPFLVEALWRREVAEEKSDRSKALGKAEIAELLGQNMDVHEIERYFPDIESDPDAPPSSSARTTSM